MRKLLFLSLFLFLTDSALAQQFNAPLATQRQFYDSNGNYTGSAMTDNMTGRTDFYGQQGQYIGDAQPNGYGQTYFYDQSGVNVGSMMTE